MVQFGHSHLRVQFLHCQLSVSHHPHHSISSRRDQPGAQPCEWLVWVRNGISSSLAGCSLFSRNKEPRTCHLHTDSRKGCTTGRGGFRHVETLGNHHQMHMHMYTHPSMVHPEITSSINAHANIQGQQPKSPLLYPCQCCLPLPPQTYLASHTLDQKGKN